MKVLYVLLAWCVGIALGATHVNISIAQHPATNPADVTYLTGSAPAELKAGPSSSMKNGEMRFARLRTAEESSDGKVQMNGEQRQDGVLSFSGSGAHSSQQQVQPLAEQSNSVSQQQNQQQRFYGRLRQSQIRQSQFRQANGQDKQNQEFERYIQNYHSGPTVETVFETSDHSPSARYSSSSTKSSTSARLVAFDTKPVRNQIAFERQVALPAVAAAPSSATSNEQSHIVQDSKIQIPSAPVSMPTSAPAQVSPAVLSSSSTGSTTMISASSDGGKVGIGGSFGTSFGASPSGVTFRVAGGNGGGGYSQPSYDQATSYAKPEYEQPQYNYNQDDSNGYVNEHPPSAEESSGGYDGFYSGQENNYQSNTGYAPSNPVYQRPLVTKTIQIAQPALKAKKFEVRHPAIQKEFYDIEERVVIKPAGTIVVELERPVAKIPKGETVLPLGHPHPAIAAQYNQNGDADIETESSSSASYNNGVRTIGNQVYTTRKQPAAVSGTTHIGSTITATPVNNQNVKRDFVEANLRKQYGEEAQLVAPKEVTIREQNSRAKELYIPVENQSNQRQVSNRIYSTNNFRREENNYVQRPARVELKSNEQSLKTNGPEPQSNFNNDDDEYKGEYVTGNFYSTINKDPKPARLQQAPARSERVMVEPKAQAQIIKHEHTINIPPSQHNIYIAPSNLESRSIIVQEQRKLASAPRQQKPTARLEEETAHVQEIKPYLKRQRDGVLVYAVPARRSMAAQQQQRYTQNEGKQQQFLTEKQQSRSYAQLRFDQNFDKDADDASVEYSAPYSHMRFDPKESARLTADVEYNSKAYKDNSPQKTVSIYYNRGPESHARLIAQNNSEIDGQQPAKTVESKLSAKSELQPLAHIQLQVPNDQQEANEPIRVMSEIHPLKEQSQTTQAQQLVATKQNTDDQVEEININQSENDNDDEDVSRSSNVESKPNCEGVLEKVSARYENKQQSDVDNYNYNDDQYAEVKDRSRTQVKSLRLIDTSSSNSNNKDSVSQSASSNTQAELIDSNVKDATATHVTSPGSRVIAANPAPSDASAASESFHKRRIVVNHPFQTVREVVEHEPITNYHQIQVHEPASPASAYHNAPYFAPNGALRQFETRTIAGVPTTYVQSSATTHGNLVYVLPDAIPVHEHNGEEKPKSSFQQRERQ